MSVSVDIHVCEVLIDESDKSRKVSLPIDDLVDRPQFATFAISLISRTRFTVVFTLLLAKVAAEPELLFMASVAFLSFLHVLVDLADWQ